MSVIIPNYNHAPFLRQRLDSVLGQTFQDFEVILLDDCSTDDSRSILSQYIADPRVRIDFNRVNSGNTFKQWNKGVRMARGEYVWIAESDDYADPRLLEKLLAVLDAEQKAAFAYCQSWQILGSGQVRDLLDSYLSEADGNRWTKDFCVDGRKECEAYFAYRNIVVNASAVVFRKTIFEQVGGADESLVLCGDWKLWVAMALTGKVAYVAEHLNHNRLHEITVTARSRRSGVEATEYLRVIRWILQRVTVTKKERRRICRRLAYVWVNAAIDRKLPFGRRLAILRDAIAIDHSAITNFVQGILVALRLTAIRRYRSAKSSLGSN